MQNKKANVSGGSQKPFYVSVTLINKEKRRIASWLGWLCLKYYS